MTEQLFNAGWLTVAIAAFSLFVPRTHTGRKRAILAIAALAVLLFPFISVTDDFSSLREMQEAVAVLVTMVSTMLFLVVLARFGSDSMDTPASFVTAQSDPRSPPRR